MKGYKPKGPGFHILTQGMGAPYALLGMLELLEAEDGEEDLFRHLNREKYVVSWMVECLQRHRNPLEYPYEPFYKNMKKNVHFRSPDEPMSADDEDDIFNDSEEEDEYGDGEGASGDEDENFEEKSVDDEEDDEEDELE